MICDKEGCDNDATLLIEVTDLKYGDVVEYAICDKHIVTWANDLKESVTIHEVE